MHPHAVYFTPLKSPHGPMLAAWSEAGVCRLAPPGHGMDELHAWADGHAPGAPLLPAESDPFGLQAQLDEYFAGARQDFDLPLDPRGTPFQRAVWAAVCAVPYGETRSYADIARTVGRPTAARAVGAANAINPVCLVIPCHRIIGADGTLKGYAGGVLNRRLLLGIEQRQAHPDGSPLVVR